jgi:hypothetical protein
MYIKTVAGSGSVSTRWKNVAEFYIKTGASVWSRVRQGYIKVSATSWKRFFFEANLPGVTTKPSIRETNTGSGTMYDGPVATSPQYLDADLYGKDGVYTNYTSITSRRFSWADTENSATRSTVVFDDRFNTAGGITASTRLSLDEDYLFYEVQVNNGTGDDFINPVSNPIKLIKKEPALGPFTTSLTGNASPNSTLTFNYNLENYYYNRVEQGNSKIRWWRSSSQSPSGTLLKEETISATLTDSNSSSLSGQSTYTIAASADNDSYIVVEILAASSWTRHFAYGNEYQLDYFSTAKVQAPYRFSFGKTIYVGTNGYIGLDAGAYSAAGLPFGRAISVFVKDFTQYYLAEYSDSSVYYLYIKSYLYNTSAASSNALDYQIKFYNDPNINYCDVYIVRKGANVPSLSDFAPGYYGDYGQPDPKYAGMAGPYFIGQGTTFRVSFGDAAAYTGVGWTSVSDAIWDVIQTWSYPPGLDDDFTAVVSAANQQVQAPTNSSLPTLSTDTSNFSAGSTISVNTGTWSGAASYTYELLYSTSDPVLTTAATKTLVNTNQYLITLGDATASSYYFRPKITAWSGANQTGMSTIAYGTTSVRSTIIPTTSISVGSSTSTGFTISGFAAPIVSSISTSYVAIDEIYIYNSSQQLVSTITTGLPAVSVSNGSWSYTWTGHSGAVATYYAKVRVRSTDSDQTKFTTAFSNSISTSAATTTPTSLTATTDNNTKIALSWSGGAGDTYLFYWTTSNTFRPDNTSTYADFTTTNSSTCDWTSMVRGTTYYFFIRARSGTSPNFTYSSAWFPSSSPGITGKAPLYAPGTPTDLATTLVTSSRIDISWSAPGTSSTQDSASGYDIYYSTSSTAPSSSTTPSTTSTTTTKSITSLSQDTTYYFWVRATNSDAKSSWTSSINPKTRLTTPTLNHTKRYVYENDLTNSLTRISSSTKRQDWSYSAKIWYDLTWGANTSATSYDIFFADSTNSAPSDADGADYTSTSAAYNDYWNQSNRSTVTWYYWVRSRNSTNTSAWSNATGGPSTATVVSGLSLTLVNNSSGATSSASPGNASLTYTWSGVSTSALHYSRISATIAGTASGSVRSPGAV